MRIAVIPLLVALTACRNESSSSDEFGRFAEVQDVPEVTAFGGVWSFAPDDVWVTAEGGRMLHYDGSAWSEDTLETPAMMVALWGFAPDDLWAVGGETLAQWDGSTWTITDLQQQNAGIEGITSIWASSPSDVWLGGWQSTAAHFDGSTWDRTIVAGHENTAVWGSGPSDVYMIGLSTMEHFDGSTWEEVDVPNEIGSPESVWGFGSDDVWMASGSEEVAHYDGATWDVTEIDAIGGPERLWGRAPDDLWGVGQFGSITHYDGSTWREEAAQRIGSPFLRSLHAIHGSAAGDLWVVGSQAGEGGITPLLWHSPG